MGSVCSRWVSLLLFALVLLPELLCVDVKGLEGVNRQQHVSNVSLGGERKCVQTRSTLKQNSLGRKNKSEDFIQHECGDSSSTLGTHDENSKTHGSLI